MFAIRKISSFEFFVTSGVIFFLAFVTLIYLEQILTKAKEVRLIAELRNIRIAINVYKEFNDKYPDDIRELVEKEIYGTRFIHEIYKRPYLEHQRVDKEGSPIDPWDRRFCYDSSSGKIFSKTKGYEDW